MGKVNSNLIKASILIIVTMVLIIPSSTATIIGKNGSMAITSESASIDSESIIGLVEDGDDDGSNPPPLPLGAGDLYTKSTSFEAPGGVDGDAYNSEWLNTRLLDGSFFYVFDPYWGDPWEARTGTPVSYTHLTLPTN